MTKELQRRSRSTGTLAALAVVVAVVALGVADRWWHLGHLREPGVTAAGDGVVIAIDMPKAVQQLYATATEPRDPALRAWTEVTASVGDGESLPARIHVRGNNSARFPRKPLTLDLLQRRAIVPGLEAKKLYLLNLAFDPHGLEMGFCCPLLHRIGLFPAISRFARVAINGADQGLYMLVERPRDALRRVHADVVSVVRLNREGFEVRWNRTGVNPRAITRELTKALAVADAGARARRLDELLDLDMFAAWMACNSVMQNADSGEVFLCELRPSGQTLGRLGVMGWDYDDLMEPPAHPDEVLPDRLSWAAENAVEKAMLSTPVLYERYRAALRRLLTTELSEGAIRDRLAALLDTLHVVDPAGVVERAEAAVEFETTLLARRAELSARLDER